SSPERTRSTSSCFIAPPSTLDPPTAAGALCAAARAPVQSGFDGPLRHAEALSGLGNVLFMKIVERQGVAILRRKRQDGAPHGAVSKLDIVAGEEGARVAWLGDHLERYRSRRNALDLGTI